jgi:hypothetical protein
MKMPSPTRSFARRPEIERADAATLRLQGDDCVAVSVGGDAPVHYEAPPTIHEQLHRTALK